MSIRRRLRRLETARNEAAHPALVPWTTDGHEDGFAFRGERLTWEEYERRHPGGPRPLRWLGAGEALSPVESEDEE